MHPSLTIAAVQNRLPAGLCQCQYTYEDLLFIQLCNDPTPVHCNTVLGKKRSPLASAAVQNRLPAGLCQCQYTYEDLLFMQLCSNPAPVLCNTVLGKKQSPLASAAVQHRLPTDLCHCKYTYEDLLFSAALQNRLTACILALQLHLMEICYSYRCAVTDQQCS